MKKNRKNKRTPAQLAQQKRFALAVSFLAPLKEIIQKGFLFVSRRKKRKLHPFNLAMSQVLKVAITELSGVLSLDPEKAWLSDGNLPGVLVTDMQQLAGTITVQYFGDTGFDRCWDDRVKLIAYQAEEWVAVESAVSALRHEAKVSITIPVNLWEKDLLLYILCHERDGLRYSRSKYLGTYQIKK